MNGNAICSSWTSTQAKDLLRNESILVAIRENTTRGSDDGNRWFETIHFDCLEVYPECTLESLCKTHQVFVHEI